MIRKLILRSLCVALFMLVQLIALKSYAATIDNVTVEGNRRIPIDRISGYLIEQKTEFDLNKINDSVKRLYATGLFLNVQTDFSVEDARVVLKYIVEEMPLIGQVRYNGNVKLKKSKLDEKVEIKRGQQLSIPKVERALDAIRALYEDENRFGTKITFRIEPRTINSVDVVFDIVEAEKSKIYNIWVYGNDNVSTDIIKEAMPTKERQFWTFISSSGKISKEMLAADRELVRLVYLERGYAKVNVSEPELQVQEEDPSKVNMIVRVKEGDQYRVRSIAYSGQTSVVEGTLRDNTSLKEGEVFNVKYFQNDIQALTTIFTATGYAYANVEPIVQLDDETRAVDLTFKIEEGSLVQVARINISGNRTSHDNVIRRQIDQMEGSLYNSRLIMEAKANAMATGFYSNVEIKEVQTSNNTVDIDINVTEQSTGTFTVGAAYSSLDGLMGSVQLSRNNFLGLGHSTYLRAEVSAIRTDFSFSYTEPWLFDWPVSAGVDAFSMTRIWDDYSRRSTGGSIRLGHALMKRRLSMNYRFSIYQVNIYDIAEYASRFVKAQRGSIWTHSFSPSLVWNSLNNYLDPSRGNKSEVYIDLAGTVFGGDAHFVKVGGESSQFIPLFADIVLMLHAKVGFIFPTRSGVPIPIDERFRLGGINSIRGFRYGDISPVDSDGYRYGGDKFAQANVEIIFPIKDDIKLKGVVFFDIGQVNKEGEYLFETGTRQSAGLGIRWLTPMGTFRLEWGYKLNKKANEEPYRFEFSIGGVI